MIVARYICCITVCWIIAGCSQDAVFTPADMAENDLGVALMGHYDYAEAHDVFANVVERAPGWLDARVNLAIATLNRQGDGDDLLALEIVSGVLNDDPEQLRALYLSGLIHLYVGKPEPAIDFFQRVVAADPRDAYAAFFLGQSLSQLGSDADAVRWMLRAVELDPYLRSAYYAASQLLRRQGENDEAARMLEDYKRFEPNPAARVAGFAYRRMGPKADALAVVDDDAVISPLPVGTLFAGPRLIDSGDWSGASLTTVDMNADGFQDLLISAHDRLGILRGAPDGAFELVTEHALFAADSVRAALWGDIDDDGLVDAVLCGAQGTSVWYQASDDRWEPQAISARPCTSGSVFDADHDGDLDIFVTGADGNELLNNNRDGSFRMLADAMGLRGSHGQQIAIADLDADRDLDIIVVNTTPPHDVWQNDRTWTYRQFAGLDEFRNTPLMAVTAADTNADGHVEIIGLSTAGDLHVWQTDGTTWTGKVLRQSMWSQTDLVSAAELSVADFDGDGRPEILFVSSGENHSGFSLIDPDSGETRLDERVNGLTSAIAVSLEARDGPAIIGVGANGLNVWPAGKARHPFMALVPTGRNDDDQMRSNASGIGTRIMVRSAGQWTVLDALDPHSGPGQSLAPLSAGLGGRDQAGFVALQWSDGVSQTEIGLDAGRRHEISETQRQLASCPVVFAWNGERYEFISDVLGVGGIGFFIEPGVYAPPRPFEGYLLEENTLVPRNGNYIVKLTEPMEENAYIDAVRIHVFDVPDGWSVVLDERMGIYGPDVTGRPVTFRRALDPVRVFAADGSDVTDLVTTRDNHAPSPGDLDRRFIGLLADDQVLTFEFDQPLNGEGLALLADGWIEYPYSQTVFAAWQAGVGYRSATLEARDADGRWSTVVAEFGYPAGMPRKMLLPIDNLPPGTDALRISSNMEIYWDRLQIIWEEPLEFSYRTTIKPSVARVARSGFAKRSNGPQRLPHYDYADRSPYWDTKYQRGFYTAFGDATELVTEVDGAVAIFGGGEEIHLEFPATAPAATGTRRFFALDFRGWAKDMDLYTQDGETVGPLPTLAGIDEAALQRRDRLHARFNVRFQEGL